MPQTTITGSRPVSIPGLPDDLDAFPIYRVMVAAEGRETSRKLLRLEVRAAYTEHAEDWSDALASLDRRDREWLLKNKSGQRKKLQERFGTQALRLLYLWCASGIAIFEVEVPPAHGAGHGALISWRLTDPIQDHVRQTADQSRAQRARLTEEASNLAAALDGYPDAGLLAELLNAPRNPSYLEHTITVARDYLARPPVRSGEICARSATWDLLTRLGRATEKDYSKDPAPIGEGGQGSVLGAVHKITGVRVAFKRLRFHDEDCHARMRREIEAGHRFAEHPNVVPVLDADHEGRWFTMPVADGTAASHACELRETCALRGLVEAVCDALRRPHEEDWIHRDVKPANILLLEGRWTVGDWGLGRRPRGETSDPRRTRSGSGFGTEGFAAPELSDNAHEVTAAADIYSLGQVIGTLVTGQRPQANIPCCHLLAPGKPSSSRPHAGLRLTGRKVSTSSFACLIASHKPPPRRRQRLRQAKGRKSR